MIDCPAFCAGVVIGLPKPPSRTVLGVVARPGHGGDAVGELSLTPSSLCATLYSSASAKNRLSVAFSRSRSLSPLTSSRRTEWRPSPRGASKVLVAKARPTIYTTSRFSYAAAETAIERPAHTAFQWPVESKHKHRCKVCRTRDEQPISEGE